MIYVLYGTEKYLIDQKLKSILSKENISFDNISKYDMKETPLSFVLEDALMPSLFTNKKFIICNNCYFLTASTIKSDIDHNTDELVNYINLKNNDTIIIFIVDYETLDERKKVVKLLKKETNLYKANKLIDNDLINYIINHLKENNYKISRNDALYLKDRTNNNLDIVYQELNKLMLYKENEKEITEEDINELVSKNIDDNIFSLINAVVDNNKPKIMEIYNELIRNNEEPVKIIVLIANQFRLIYQTKVLYNQGYTEKDISSKLGVHPYRIKLAYQKGKIMDEKKILKYLSYLANLDFEIKSGKIDKYLGLELFLLKI
ncbi:MAG: DNA polymerase III subunit delta [Bacilli bacterium]